MAAALCLVVGILAAAPVARADTVIGTVAAPTPVSAYGGRLAWSSFDPATKRYALLTQFGGTTTPVPVATRGVPFDVDLGPDQNGDTVASTRVAPPSRGRATPTSASSSTISSRSGPPDVAAPCTASTS